MPLSVARLSVLIVALGGAMAGCATTGADKTGQEIAKAGLKGPIEARGPATAAPPRDDHKTGALANAGRADFYDREKDRWYFYDEKRHRYRWENGEPKI